ncbi:MAG: cytochrome c biogenesis protein CcsA [Chloroflexi bacterium]|nr:cytochrome c biogenesis protein CcsA [Chloroflexota bacterium]
MIGFAHTLYWAALVATGGASLLFAGGASFGRQRLAVWGVAATALALALLTVALLARWTTTGHGPYLGLYEALASYAWVLLALFLAVQWRLPQLRPAGVLAAPGALLLLGSGVLSASAPQFQSPAMRSMWLWVHVGMAKVALASLVVGAGASLVYLRRAKTAVVAALGPSTEDAGAGQFALEDLSVRLVSLGFLVLAVVIATGAVWANTAWGAYWSWDPVETWALATWVIYGGLLHLHRMGGWHAAKWARANLGALALSAFLFVALRLLASSPHWIYTNP